MDSKAQRVFFPKDTKKLCVWHTESGGFYHFTLVSHFQAVIPNMGGAG